MEIEVEIIIDMRWYRLLINGMKDKGNIRV